jgi:ubiquinone/menaquinone biosynthesis C-methylase UbiE
MASDTLRDYSGGIMALTDRNYLLNDQYKDSTNIAARMNIHEKFSVNKQGWFPWLFEHFELPEHGNLLELGCGRADMWAKNLQLIPNGLAITLSDFSPGMLADAQRSLDRAANRFTFKVIDAQSIPFEDDAFDIVIANHMLYHVPDRKKALSEMRRVLKRDGVFFASTIGENHLKELAELTSEYFGTILTSWGFGVTGGFSLENGAGQIAEFFETVNLYRYEDTLEVADAAMLVDYIFSSNTKITSEEKRADFVLNIEQKIKTYGAIHITKDTGLFVAR